MIMMLKLFISFLFIFSFHCVQATTNAQQTLMRLDSVLQKRNSYEEKKREELKSLYTLAAKSTTIEERYKAYSKLYEQYKSYQYDSAMVYAERCETIAQQLSNRNYVLEAGCMKAFCLLSAGLYKEAFDQMRLLKHNNVDPKYKELYYKMQVRLYYDIADYNQSKAYRDNYCAQGHIYTDSLLTLLKPQSWEWYYAIGMRSLKKHNYTACIEPLLKTLSSPDIDLHTKAIVTSCLGWVYKELGDETQTIHYLALAAIYDNMSVTKENTALRVLGGFLYTRGEINKAIDYVQLSLEDANFYDARQRKIEIGNILPIIEQERLTMLQQQRNSMAIAAFVVICLLLGLIYGVWVIKKQMKKLHKAQEIIEEQNNSLVQSNMKLNEANKIKDEYIGRSFYLNAEYISKLEKLYKGIVRKIISRQFDSLRQSVNESVLESERKSMYSDFDETFLKLFPHFIDRYEQLFEPTTQRRSMLNEHLTTEMRIFALIRLGIQDSERIAKFLNYSVHTINTYKTRVKNKSWVENDLFEQKIMEI